MCGIGGIWTRGRGRPEHLELRRMMSAMAHRGPEGAAFARADEGSLLLGFLRLGFTGGGATQQPLFDETGAVGLVFNGEIYDHDALRAELVARGHRFEGTSDSEVLLRLYLEHGDGFWEHLNGELAFVLWDARREALICARDRYGVKPLFWGWRDGAFAFASEAKGLHALSGLGAELDPDYWSGPGVGVAECSLTPFAGVRSVRPGHVLTVTRRGIDERAWFEPRFGGPAPATLDEATRAVRRGLTRAVRRRLDGDPPIAVSLSSGIDSTIVCGLVAADQRRRGRPVTAFTIGYDGAFYDESAQAARTAAHHGVRFERVRCTPTSLADGLLEGIHSVEVPTNSLSTTARLALTRAVRGAGFKALISGEGSDELFGGYPYFGIEAIWRRARVDPRGARALLRAFRRREALSRGMFWSGGRAPDPGAYGFASAYEARVRRTEGAMRWMFAEGFRRRMSRTPWETACAELDPARLSRMSPFDATRAIARSVLGSLVIPSLGDRVEMAASLEGRAPYLDRDLVALACSLPERFCLEPTTMQRKHVLRRAFADLVPPRLAPPPKHTRMAPTFADLFGVPRGREVLELALDPAAVKRAGIFDPRFVRALRAAWRWWPKGGHRHAMLDMALGYVATTQALHLVHVEDLLSRRGGAPRLPLDEDRSPDAKVRARAAGGAR